MTENGINIYWQFSGRLSDFPVPKGKGQASPVVSIHLIRMALGVQISWKSQSVFLEVLCQFRRDTLKEAYMLHVYAQVCHVCERVT